MNKPLTIFSDLDGTLIKHCGTLARCVNEPAGVLLPGVEEFLQQVYSEGHRLIITTGRPECLREITVFQLKRLGIFYDQLVMDCTPGVRVLINDKKSDGSTTALAVNVSRNEGVNSAQVFAQ